jgi:hypothetical protein
MLNFTVNRARRLSQLSCCLLATLLASCAVNKQAADTVVLTGRVEKVYDPCTQSLTNNFTANVDQPPGIATIGKAMESVLKPIDKALAPRECLFLIRQTNTEQLFFRTSQSFAVGSCVKVYLTAEKMRAWKSINPLLTNTLVEPGSAIEASACP